MLLLPHAGLKTQITSTIGRAPIPVWPSSAYCAASKRLKPNTMSLRAESTSPEWKTAVLWRLKSPLRYPEIFAGAISLGGGFPAGGAPLANLEAARDLPLFLTSYQQSSFYPVELACDDLRLFHAAGLRVMLRQYPGKDGLCKLVLADLDRWIMEQVTQPDESAFESVESQQIDHSIILTPAKSFYSKGFIWLIIGSLLSLLLFYYNGAHIEMPLEKRVVCINAWHCQLWFNTIACRIFLEQ